VNICIVGAGFAGLSAAKVLKSFGHRVTVFEKEADVGGVWSRSRRYPGLTTQNVRSTYAFSDFPYPKDYPEWPSGEQVQRYLESYTKEFGFADDISLGSTVTAATLDPGDGGWTVEVSRARAGAAEPEVSTHHFDYLVVCNGIFSQPAIPEYTGASAFVASGGTLCHTSQFGDLAAAAGKHVVVIGYGKSSCDVAQAVAGTAASTTVVARQLLWKMPKMLMNALNYKFLLLTRLGEALFKYITVRGFESFLHGPGKPVRDSMLGQVQWVATQQCKLDKLGLNPGTPFESIARSTVSLVTDGFFESVAAGKIRVVRDAAIDSLNVAPSGARTATLTTGETVAADVVICGTGWHQTVPFFDAALTARITDADGNFLLYRSMIPVGVPRLAFNGYNSSFFSQLNAEIGALWLAGLLSGTLALPSEFEQRQAIAERLAWMEARTDGKHAKGTNIIPFSVHHIDELLADMDLSLGRMTKLKQYLMPIDPGDFAGATRALRKRLEHVAPVAVAAEPVAAASAFAGSHVRD
jgi:cation diffusion facilitator CzcD-associated flavoprotein CzcO